MSGWWLEECIVWIVGQWSSHKPTVQSPFLVSFLCVELWTFLHFIVLIWEKKKQMFPFVVVCNCVWVMDWNYLFLIILLWNLFWSTNLELILLSSRHQSKFAWEKEGATSRADYPVYRKLAITNFFVIRISWSAPPIFFPLSLLLHWICYWGKKFN